MFEGGEPLYLQIAASIREDILSGRLTEGDRVMSTAEFATTHRVNPATTSKGFALLVDEGLIHKRRGLGMFISEGARDRLMHARRQVYFDSVLKPALAEAHKLGIGADQLLHYIKENS